MTAESELSQKNVPLNSKYCYDALVTGCYDGDTITADIELGLGIVLKNQKIRLLGINSPEIKGANHDQGVISRDIMRSLVLGKTVELYTHQDKRCKYGRILGTIIAKNPDGSITNCNEHMVANGYAVPYMTDV